MLPRLKTLLHILKSTKNWLSVLMVRYGSKQKTNAIFRSGYVLPVTKGNWKKYIYHAYFFSFLPEAKLFDDHVEFPYHSKKLAMYFGKWGFDTILEIFATDPYKDFLNVVNPKDKVVIDVGASFGDTAIYFLTRGAKKVYAFEPFPGYFHLAKKNILNNGFADYCEVINAAVGGASGEISIDPDMEDMFGIGFEPPVDGCQVPVMTLQQIIDKYDISDAFLKIDTEGFEYDIIENSSVEALRHFSDMLIEYHYGFEKLEKVLSKAGFLIIHTGPTHIYMPQYDTEEKRNMYTGHIIAKRK